MAGADNKNKIKESKYAIQRTTEEDQEYQLKRAQRNRLDINSQILNEIIEVINEKINDHPKFDYLTYDFKIYTWNDALKKYAKRKLPNDCYYLGGLVPDD